MPPIACVVTTARTKEYLAQRPTKAATIELIASPSRFIVQSSVPDQCGNVLKCREINLLFIEFLFFAL